MTKKDSKTRKGEAKFRLLNAMFKLAPKKYSREKFLYTLRDEFGDPLKSSERANAAKAVGRMIAQGQIEAIITPNVASKDIGLNELGLIAISIDLLELNIAHKDWKLANEGPEPSQEQILVDLVAATADWENLYDGKEVPQILMRDHWIVHGSNQFDIILVVSYSYQALFIEFVREVVQRQNCIAGTQTMQISRGKSPNSDMS